MEVATRPRSPIATTKCAHSRRDPVARNNRGAAQNARSAAKTKRPTVLTPPPSRITTLGTVLAIIARLTTTTRRARRRLSGVLVARERGMNQSTNAVMGIRKKTV